MLETLDYTIRIGSTPTFLYFDLYLYSAYAAHFVYITKNFSYLIIIIPLNWLTKPSDRRNVWNHLPLFFYCLKKYF